MSEEELRTYGQLDSIVDMMESGRKLSDEELKAIMLDEDLIRSYKELNLLKTVAKSKSTADFADADKAWTHFQQKYQEIIEDTTEGDFSVKRYLWGAGIAASLLVFVVLGLTYFSKSKLDYPGFLTYKRSEVQENVIIKNNVGNIFILDKHQRNISNGTAFYQHEQLVIDYHRIAHHKIVATNKMEGDTVSVPSGRTAKMILADGSEVWLYPESKMIYPSTFVGETRCVYLKGEAYFKVAKDAKHPFVVYAGNIQTRVLGTEFNIRCYPNESTHVALLRGKVCVSSKSGKNVVLSPGQGASLNNKLFHVKDENMDRYEYWRNGYIYFDEEPLSEIATALGRWYNINVVFKNKSLMNKRIRFFCLRSEPVQQATEFLNGFNEFTATVKDNTLLIW